MEVTLTLDTIQEELEELATDYRTLEAHNKTYQDKLEEIAEYQRKCEKHIVHQRYRMGIISKQLKRLKGDKETKKEVDEFENNLLKRNVQLAQIEQTLPKRNGIYLRIILGNVNVSILNKDDKIKYKDEYEKFKLIISIISVLLGIFNLSVHSRPLELILVFLLVWYYCTLTIRESILKVNGSRIKGWWQLHHFLMTVVSAIILIWPATGIWTAFRNQFMVFNVYIGAVQYLQFRYQHGQLYRLKALGELQNMDITIEGFHSWMWRGLSFLLPFLFVAYIFQIYNAYTLYLLSFEPTATWHVPVLSLFFLVLFLGNISTTIMVIPNKIRDRMVLRYRLMSQRVNFTKNSNIEEESSSDATNSTNKSL